MPSYSLRLSTNRMTVFVDFVPVMFCWSNFKFRLVYVSPHAVSPLRVLPWWLCHMLPVALHLYFVDSCDWCYSSHDDIWLMCHGCLSLHRWYALSLVSFCLLYVALEEETVGFRDGISLLLLFGASNLFRTTNVYTFRMLTSCSAFRSQFSMGCFVGSHNLF